MTYSNIKNYIINILVKIRRSYNFAKIGWSNGDFDNGYLNELILFKLERMLYFFEHKGYHSTECINYKPKMKSLKLAIKLLKKINKDHYLMFSNLHDKKWGEQVVTYVPHLYDNSNKKNIKTYKMEFTVENADTPEKQKIERQERLDAYRADDRLKQKDVKRVFNIIAKYSEYWWD